MKNYIVPVLAQLILFLSVTVKAQDNTNFYDLNTIQDVKLEFEKENWKYLLDSLRFNGDGMLIGNIEVNGKTYSDVGVRYWLGTSFQSGALRNDLHIQLDAVRKNQKHAGHAVIKLSSAVRDPSMVREVIAYQIARKYMPASKANFARLSINEENRGLYVNVEPVDKGFLEMNFGESDGDFFYSDPKKDDMRPLEDCKSKVFGTLKPDNYQKCYDFNFNDLNGNGFSSLMRLVNILNRNPENIDEILDVDRTLWMLAFNNIIVNLDSYTGKYSPNYYLYRNKYGKFIPILWDMNLAFGSFKNIGVGSDLKQKALIEMDPLLHMDNSDKPLLNVLLQEKSYQKVYLSHMRTILYSDFLNVDFESKVSELQAMIEQDFIDDPYKYYEIDDFENSQYETVGRKSKIPGIVKFMNERARFLKKHPKMLIVPSEIEEVNFERREKFSNDYVKEFRIQAKVNNFPKMVFIHYRFEEDEQFQYVRAYDDGQHNDEEANDGIFGATIQPAGADTKMQYYIYTENAAAVNFAPTRYMYEPYTISLAELNK